MGYREVSQARKILQRFAKNHPADVPITLRSALQEIGQLGGMHVDQDVILAYLRKAGYRLLQDLEAVDTVLTESTDRGAVEDKYEAYTALLDADIDALLEDELIANEDAPLISTGWHDNLQNLAHYEQTGDQRKLAELIENNLGLVRKVAQRFVKYPGNTLDYEDLVSEGTIGLITAIKRFDFRQGTQLSTYAMWWIRQSIVRAIHQHGMAVRIPVHMAEIIAKIVKLEDNVEISDPDQVATKLQITLNTYQCAKTVHRMFYQHVSLNNTVGEEGSTELGELVDTAGNNNTLGRIKGDPELEFMVVERIERLTAIITRLKTKEQRVLLERFGELSPTLEMVAHGMGITRERVRQIEKTALDRTRFFLRDQQYSDWHIELED